MIRAVLTEGYYHFTADIEGHSEYGTHGNDILCAAVSAITQSFVLFCVDKEDDGCATINDLEAESGHLFIDVEGDVIDGFIMMELGLKEIAKKYPQYVEFVGRKGKRT